MRTVIAVACVLYSLAASAAASPALDQAKADAKRIGERQCEHALIMGRINRSAPETPERRAAEVELAAMIERAHLEEDMDDRYRASRDAMSVADQGVLEAIYIKTHAECGVPQK